MSRINYTMRDIARLADVSVATVSAVINNKGTVSPKLVERVNRAIAMVGFRPHRIARGLRSGRTHLIGMVIQDLTNPFFIELVRGVEGAASKHGYQIMVCNSNSEIEAERRHLNALYDHQVDGLLVAPCDSYAARDISIHDYAPIVFVDCVPMGMKVTSVVTNNFGAAYDSVRYLIGLGHRRIAVIFGQLIHSTIMDRLEGYRRAMKESDLVLAEEYPQQAGSFLESGYQCAMSLLKSSNPPTAIFAMNNRMMLGAVQALQALGMVCPDDVSIVGFDDFEWAAVFNPSLTTIAQPTFEMGANAVKLLLESIQAREEEAEPEPRQIVLQCSLQIRNSIGPAPMHVENINRRSEPSHAAHGIEALNKSRN
jgi:LacI family transcriptional regulator